MECKLCNKDKQLLKKSHIIPEFMYQDLFDDKHRIFEVLLKPDSQLKNKTRQSGAYDNNLLCHDCDNRVLGSLERYASLALYGGIELTIDRRLNHDSSTYINVKGIDYQKFKLFLLSILWRASISNLPIFKGVKLGAHESIIRKKILTNSPGDSVEYQCAVFTHLHNPEIPNQIIAEPGCIIDGEQQTYAFLIGGNLFVFFTYTGASTEWVQHCTVKENGEMNIIQMSDDLSIKVVNKFMCMDLLQ
jgi:hypothetical protein